MNRSLLALLILLGTFSFSVSSHAQGFDLEELERLRFSDDDDDDSDDDDDDEYKYCEDGWEGCSVFEKTETVIAQAEGLMAFGTQVVDMMTAGRPNYNISMAPAIHVLPELDNDAFAFSDMENWKDPKVERFKINVNTKVSFDYMINFFYGGTYEGAGQYISGIKFAIENAKFGWTKNLDVSSSLVSIANMGTRENPMASAVVELSYETYGIMKRDHKTEMFLIKGDGTIRKL